MAQAGRIYHEYTHIETDEQGHIWLIQNHFESDTVIEEMDAAAHGEVIIDEGYEFIDEEDYFDDL